MSIFRKVILSTLLLMVGAVAGCGKVPVAANLVQSDSAFKSPASRTSPVPTVRPMVELTGRVVDESGEAIDAVVVQLEPNVAQELTDSDGRFALSRVPSGKYVLTVSVAGYCSREVRLDTESQVSKDFFTHAIVLQPKNGADCP